MIRSLKTILTLLVLMAVSWSVLAQAVPTYKWVDNDSFEFPENQLSKESIGAIVFEIEKSLAKEMIFKSPEPDFLLQLSSTRRIIQPTNLFKGNDYESPWEDATLPPIEDRKLFLSLIHGTRSTVFHQMEISFLTDLNGALSDHRRARIVRRVLKKFPSSEELQKALKMNSTNPKIIGHAHDK